MNEKNLEAISPVDGRYFDKTGELKKYFSEKALIYYRLKVEVEYFIALCEAQIPQLSNFNNKKFFHFISLNIFNVCKSFFLNYEKLN